MQRSQFLAIRGENLSVECVLSSHKYIEENTSHNIGNFTYRIM